MALNYLQIYEYLQSQNGTHRKVTYADEQKLRHYILTRDPRTLEYSAQIFDFDSMGVMNLNNRIQMYFGAVASITLITRHMVEAGMSEEIAYGVSDLFLQQLISGMTAEDITKWHYEMVSTFLSLLPKLSEDNSTSLSAQPERISRLVSETINYVHKNLHTPLTLKEVAEVLYITPDYLSHKFRSEVGITFSQFVRSQKINVSKLMLSNPDTTLAEIAHNLAFCSQSYFTKVFREETGLTPNAYIRMIREENR